MRYSCLRLMWGVVGGAVTSCAPHPVSDERSAPVATQVAESSRYGGDRVVGILHVTTREGYFDYGRRRIHLIGAPPMTAVGLKELMIRTAADLQPLTGKRVRAQGDLQGDILWEAHVTTCE